MIRAITVFAAMVLSTVTLFSQQGSIDYGKLAKAVTEGRTGKYEQAKAIYKYICGNIEFDPTLKNITADDCVRTGKGTCLGYVRLFIRLCSALGIRTESISGHAKAIYYTPGDRVFKHIWLRVEDDNGRMFFVEPTWGSGYVSDGKFVRHDNNMSWFDVDPEWMVFTHLPDYQRQQYLTKPVAKELFMALPALYPGTSEMGIDSRKVLEMYRSGHTAGFPIINPIPGYDVKLVDFPMTRKLSVGEKYKISIRPSKGKLYAIIDNYKFRDNWQEKDGIMTIEVVPDSPGKLNLATATRNDEQYVLVLEYDIE